MSGSAQARLGAITIDVLGRAALLDHVDGVLAGTRPPAVLVSANLDHVHHFAGAAAPLPSGLAGGVEWFTLADGWPIVRALRRRLRRPVAALSGSDLLHPILCRAARYGCRVGLVGADEDTRRFWAQRLPAAYPGLVAACTWAVRWSDLDRPGWAADLAGRVAAARPDVLAVSLGKPRQEVWLREYAAATGTRLALPFGSAVEYLAGTRRRPPPLLRRVRLEWLYRLAREPRRLARRYLVEAPPALARVRRELR